METLRVDRFRQRVILVLLTGLLPVFVAMTPPSAHSDGERLSHPTQDYTFMWWAYGWRGKSPEGARVLNFQSPSYGLAFDADRARMLHLGAITGPLPYPLAASEGNERVFNLPAPEFALEVITEGTVYRCTHVDPKAIPAISSGGGNGFPDTGYVTSGNPSRLIVSGRFVQRVDFLYLVFEDDRGTMLPALGRLEVIAWPDRVGFLLEVTPQAELLDPVVRIRLQDEKGHHQASSPSNGGGSGKPLRASLSWSPSDSREFPSEAVRIECFDLNEGKVAAPAIYEATGGWYRMALKSKGRENPKDFDHLDRYELHLENPTDATQTVRLFFDFEGEDIPPITGISPMLLDSSGEPSGIPVQISKNWHRQEGKTFLYEGPWFHGYSLFHLAPGEKIDGQFVVATAHWGGVPAASHSQLCLIGWGTNQLWDQVAIGSWGESICYDPDVNLNRSMIDDVRPLMVWGMREEPESKWTWTNNVGGGDFLVYLDEGGEKQFLSRMKTAYLSYGPNLTEVLYSGVTADGKIRAEITVSTPRCDDLNRSFHRLRYEVLEPTPFSRLAFYQMGADRYNDHCFEKLAKGNGEGLIEEWTFEKGGKRYDKRGIECEGPSPWWFSLHEAAPVPERENETHGAWANRGLVVRSWKARLGGQDVPNPFASFYGTEDGKFPSMNVEISPPPGIDRLEPGDFVETELEWLVIPLSASDYYGPNRSFKESLSEGANTWRPVYREASGNDLTIECRQGELRRIYPLGVEVDFNQSAHFEVEGGIGYVPIRFSGLARPDGFELLQGTDGRETLVDQSVHGKDYWQTDFDTMTGTWSRIYNVWLEKDGGGSDSQTLTFRPCTRQPTTTSRE